ncbi:MAG: two-component regulator propeller domain-containing protein [Saprospiraceae bacterium]
MREQLQHISLFILLILSVETYSQSANSIVFQNISKGLSQNTISSFTQDDYGFIWIGTQYGLNRYDGINFKVYEDIHHDSLSFQGNTIECLLTDHNGKIWIGTYGGGVNTYDVDKDTFTHFSGIFGSKAYHDDYVTVLYQDRDSIIWVGTEKGGLLVYNPKLDRYAQYTNLKNNKGIPPTYITAISEDHSGNTWVGTFGEGLYCINKDTGVIQYFEVNKDRNSIPSNTIRSMHNGKSGRFWLGTDQGIRQVSRDVTGQVTFSFNYSIGTPLWEILNTSIILSIVEQGDMLWVGTENSGLLRVDLRSGKIDIFKHNPLDNQSLTSNSIWSIFEDKDGILWFGTFLKGMSKLDPLVQKIQHVRQMSEGNRMYSFELVSAFAEDKNGNLWVGSDGGGLSYIDQKNNTWEVYQKAAKNKKLSSNEVVAILLDREENLWVGTWNGGLNVRYRGESEFKQILHQEQVENTISGNDIYAILEDQKGRIWTIAFRAGLDVYDPETKHYVTFNTTTENRKIVSTKIRTIADDNEGRIWIGAEESGLQRITINEDLEIIDSKIFLSGEQSGDTKGIIINGLFLDSKERMWAGTSRGLFCIDTQTDSIITYTKKNGLSSNMIYAVQEDSFGKIWMSTNGELNVLDPDSKSIKVFTNADGLPQGGFYKSSSFKAKNGQIYFGGTSGFSTFNPANLAINPDLPEVYITKVDISNKQYPSPDATDSKSVFNDQKIALRYDENDFSFEFAAISYIQSSKNKYQYQLENYDDHWRWVGNDRIAQYRNVPPGKYIFKVKASNNDGLWNEEGAQVFIHIKKPWYATGLAYLVYLTSFIALLIWSRRSIIARERLRSELQLEQVELAKMQEVNQLKAQFFANISHEFKTPLTLIMSPLQNLQSKSAVKEGEKKIYNIMMRNAERLLRLISQILDLSMVESGFMKLQASEEDIGNFLKQVTINFSNYADKQFINFEINIPDQEIPVFFEKDKIEKVFVNILSNAFKFTPKYGRVTINVEDHDKEVAIKISDTGKGINLEEQELIFQRFYKSRETMASSSTGIGLSLSKQLVELHGGTISVSSLPGMPTVFTIILPKGKAHLREEEIRISNIKYGYSNSSESLVALNSLYAKLEEPIKSNETLQTTNSEKDIILVVDDNDDLRTFISTFLSPKYMVLKASNGEEAYQLAVQYIPDVIITDAVMPDADGYQLSKKIKENTLTSQIFVIMLTVKSSEESVEEGFLAGVDSYLTKPFNPKLLEMRIQNLLNSRKQYKRKIFNKQTVDLDPKVMPHTKLDEQFLKDIVEVVEANMSNTDFKVDDMCKTLGISKSQLYRKLKSLFGMSANEMIRVVRLKRAAQLLRQTKLRIAEVTYKVGFSDLQYFRDAFKKQYGMLPSEYREKMINSDIKGIE